MVLILDPLLFLAYCAACVGVGCVPGPNVTLIVANTLAHGLRYGLTSVAGIVVGLVPQMALVVVGTSALATAAAGLFGALRWAGVAYLAYLAWSAWRRAETDPQEADARPRPLRSVFLGSAFVALTNPKSLALFLLILPQFVSPAEAVGPQMVVLAATMIAVLIVMDSGWALLAGRLRPLLSGTATRWRGRITAGLFGAGALTLALAAWKGAAR